MTATNSGTVAAPGLTYANAFLFYGRDESKGADGETIATGSNSVLMDMNSLRLGERAPGGHWRRESISTRRDDSPSRTTRSRRMRPGPISGGGGLADSYLPAT